MLTQRQLRKVFPPLNRFLTPADETDGMTTSLRPAPTVEDLIRSIAELVLARQSLRASGADQLALEQNRCELVAAHWNLSHALIERHCAPRADAQSAAA